MRHMNRTAAVALLTLCSMLAGCPESVHPVSDPVAAVHDAALFGTWRGTFDGDAVYLHVGPAERGMMRAVMVEHDAKNGIKVERYSAYPTRLASLAVLNVRPLDDSHERGYSIMKYEAGANELTLWMTSYAAIRDDIRAGKLKGIAGKDPYGDTRITASGRELTAYLQAADRQRLFDKPLVFQRVP
jgi:hypothetical protein